VRWGFIEFLQNIIENNEPKSRFRNNPEDKANMVSCESGKSIEHGSST
jgi:hypothetical protein